MGLYPIDCSQCGKAFMWFSGCLDQRCQECQSLYKEEDKKEQEQPKSQKAPQVVTNAKLFINGKEVGFLDHVEYEEYNGRSLSHPKKD